MMQKNFNPDVLSCLANLSNDEVFTPPSLVNSILDMLPVELWSDPEARFLDPVCKTGVFLREIAKRLMAGLEKIIPDVQARADHILKNQIFGIAITQLTSLISRRSLYCTKIANGLYSICSSFINADGNIYFEKIEHIWEEENCKYCGASKKEYDRADELENHAYLLIHPNNNLDKIKDMKFDVVIGNPPYQLNDGGFGKSASPLYHKFVEQAIKLSPHYLIMIIPSRWFAGGKGLDDFRKYMLNDVQIRKIVDYENASDVFPGVDIAGGICYFLWKKDSSGLCEVVNVLNNTEISTFRSLNEFSTFIRNGKALPIIRKVLNTKENRMNSIVSSSKPFGLRTFVRPVKNGDIILRWQKGEGPYKRKDISVGLEMIDTWKVITSYVAYDHAGNPGKDGKRKVFSKIEILPPGTICTETYLVIGSFRSQKQAKNLRKYMSTMFFRFLVSQFMYSHHITKESYSFVPIQNFNETWSDEKLYRKYGINEAEIEFIESLIRPMELEE